MNPALPTSPPSEPASVSRKDRQLQDLRFLDALQEALAGCRDVAAVHDSSIHRVAAALDATEACLAVCEPITGSLDIVHAVGKKGEWDTELLQRVVVEAHSVTEGDVLAVPIVQHGGAGEVWGVLAVRRGGSNTRGDSPAEGSSKVAVFSADDRRTLRAAGERIAAELDRRRDYLLDDVLDGLLRKTKPIDVYTHMLRELRRFVRYDHSASIMTMQRGTAQITVRAEKTVASRPPSTGHARGESLVDSPRRGRALRLTAAQARYLGRLKRPILLVNEGEGYHLTDHDPDAAGLWRVLCLNHTSGEGSVLCYPLIFGGQMLGLLRVASVRRGAFDSIERHSRVLDRFARLLAVTLYRSELYYQSDRQLQAIKQMGRLITEPKPVDEICREMLELALRVLHVQVGAVGLLNESNQLELAAHQGCTLAEPPILTLGEGIAGGVVESGRSRAVPDVTREPAYVVFNARVRSELAVPIIYDREVIGFLDVESFEDGRFREEDEEVRTFLEALANQAAIAIKAAQLRSQAMKRLGASMSIDPSLTVAGLQGLLVEELRDKIDQLAGANDRLAAANQAKTDFLARMSHDLRGPLNVIIGLANLLTDPSVESSFTPEKQRESLGVIRSSGEVLSSLIGNILDLSALEAGKVKLQVAPVDAQAVFGYAESMATSLAKEYQHDLTTTVHVDPAITTLMVDEEKFMRILLNLISNAVKFTPSGGRLLVHASVENGDEGAPRGSPKPSAGYPDCLHVVVADSGVGIPPDQHRSIFDPFQRVVGASFGQRHGSGLGLAVVRQLVELHNGRVWVESQPDEGSTFHVVLPGVVSPGESVEAEREEERGVLVLTEAASGPPLGAAPTESPSATGERAAADVARPSVVASASAPAYPAGGSGASRGLVLVVEDTEAHMNLMRLAVTSRGYAMHGVTTGEEALDWLADHRPDVILLDMQLPGIDGFTVAARIRDRVETHTIPLIAVTADALAVNEERARASGCDAYITKPIALGTLLDTIDSVTARS